MLLDTILGLGPPVLLIIGTVAVGLSMTPAVVVAAADRPGALALMVVLQAVLLPAAAIVAILVTNASPPATFALLVIAACPGGGLSNLYVLFARANTSLSVLLTLTSIALSSLTLPAALSVMNWLGYETLASGVTPIFLTLRLIGLIAVPVAAGMALRIYAFDFARRWEERLRNITALGVLAVLAAILWMDQVAFLEALPQVALSALGFLILAMVVGVVVGRTMYSSASDRFTVMTEFAVRNLAVALYLTVSLQNDLTIVGPAATYLLLEAFLLISLGQARRIRLRTQGIA